MLRYEDGLPFRNEFRTIGRGQNLVFRNGLGFHPQIAEAQIRLCPKRLGGLQAPGDLNQDGAVDLSDAVSVLGFLFLGSPASLPCGDGTARDLANRDLLNWNGDAGVDLSDAVGLLGWLFLGGPPHVLGMNCRPMIGCKQACQP